MTGAKVPAVDPDLASSALAKVAGGASLDTLTQAEKAAIGALPPAALAEARARVTAPKAEPGSKPRDTSPPPPPSQPYDPSGAMAGATSTPLPTDKPKPRGPFDADPNSDTVWQNVGGMSLPVPKKDMNYEGFEANRAQAGAGADFASAQTIAKMPNPYATQPTDALSEASPPAKLALADVVTNVPVPTSLKTTPPVVAKETGADMARANQYIPPSSVPGIPKGMDKTKLLGLFADILDAIGGSNRAYAGVNSPTRLMKQGELNMQTEAAIKQAQATSTIELNNKLALLDPETKAIIQRDEAANKASANSQVDVATRLQAINIALARAGKAPIFLDPETYAKSIVAAKSGGAK